jgi:transcriptional regulator with XRE-family HTH domain
MLIVEPSNGTKTVTPDSEDFYKALGRRIADLRQDQDMTQQQLADALGLSQRTVGHYEVGRIRLQVSILLDMADCLGVSVSDLLEPLRKRFAKRKTRARPAEHN